MFCVIHICLFRALYGVTLLDVFMCVCYVYMCCVVVCVAGAGLCICVVR